MARPQAPYRRIALGVLLLAAAAPYRYYGSFPLVASLSPVARGLLVVQRQRNDLTPQTSYIFKRRNGRRCIADVVPTLAARDLRPVSVTSEAAASSIQPSKC